MTRRMAAKRQGRVRATGSRLLLALVVILALAPDAAEAMSSGTPNPRLAGDGVGQFPRDSAACTATRAKVAKTRRALTTASKRVAVATKKLRKARKSQKPERVRKAKKALVRARKHRAGAKRTHLAAQRAVSASCKAAPSAPEPDPEVPLPPTHASLVLLRGSTSHVPVTTSPASYRLSGTVVTPPGVTVASSGGGVAVTAGMATAAGNYDIAIAGELCQNSSCRSARIVVALTVTEFADVVAPTTSGKEVTLPSLDRIEMATTFAGTQTRALTDEVLVTLRQDLTGPEARASIEAIATSRGAYVTGGIGDLWIFELRWEHAVGIEDEIARIGEMADVDGVSASLMDSVSTGTAGGSVVPQEWSTDAGWEDGWHLRAANVPEAWRVTTGSDDVYVGVIDVGIPIRSVELSTWPVSAPGTGTQLDADGHPDHVSGIACASENGRGIVGVSWGCPLYNAAVADVSGYRFWKSAAAAAQKLVEDTPVHVVNMSLGIGPRSGCTDSEANEQVFEGRLAAASLFRPLFSQGRGADVLWSLSAGNNCSPSPDSPMGFFSGFDNVITVASTNEDGRLSSFSNYGAGVEVAAPGGVDRFGNGILSLVRSDALWCEEGDVKGIRNLCFGYMYGTSMAAPVVAGIAHLMFSANPDITANQVGQCITSTATTSVPSRSSEPQGFQQDPSLSYPANSLKLVDAGAAVDCALSLVPTPVDPNPSIDCGAPGGIPTSECAFLTELKAVNPNAIALTGGEQPCQWQGVSCANGHVVGLALAHSNLRTLPATISNLTGLRSLWLEANQLTTLPAQVGDLPHLESLRLNDNNLVTIPTAVRTLTTLESLHLAGNGLSTVPAWLGGLTRLDEIDLQFNQLTEVPPAIREIVGLRVLGINDNRLTAIPSWIGELSGLTHLVAHQNAIVTVPASLGQLDGLMYLNLHENRMAGDITAWARPLSESGNMWSLTLRDNGCLTVTDSMVRTWLNAQAPGWDDGC